MVNGGARGPGVPLLIIIINIMIIDNIDNHEEKVKQTTCQFWLSRKYF